VDYNDAFHFLFHGGMIYLTLQRESHSLNDLSAVLYRKVLKEPAGNCRRVNPLLSQFEFN
ncbi:MAG TPA: hypothetical protein VJS18_11595, partial [Paraburkholderia sp.]|nr:hypothetical protein [Paraburkholderia sp.]